MSFQRADKIELLLIALAAVLAVPVAMMFAGNIAIGEIALIASGLLLSQGLARDLWIKFRRKAAPPQNCSLQNNQATGTCMCVESTLGILGIICGVAVLFSGIGKVVTLPTYAWPLLVIITGFVGFAVKSLVIDWKARRIRIIRDHSTVRFK